jgi:putative ABC transport system ATP-binding protein
MTRPSLPPIRAEGLTRSFPYGGSAVQALRGVSLEVHPGEWVAIMGPSGCGKSTLLNVIAGIDRPDTGSVQLLGRDLATLSETERARLRLLHVGFVFQRFHLLSVLTATENVELPMSEAGVVRRDRRERARELLTYVGLGHRLDHRPPQLSGGEQQRVAIARALGNRPELLLADEPTGELDQATGAEILDLLAQLNHQGTALVTVTHDEAVARRAHRVVRLSDGRVVA